MQYSQSISSDWHISWYCRQIFSSTIHQFTFRWYSARTALTHSFFCYSRVSNNNNSINYCPKSQLIWQRYFKTNLQGLKVKLSLERNHIFSLFQQIYNNNNNVYLYCNFNERINTYNIKSINAHCTPKDKDMKTYQGKEATFCSFFFFFCCCCCCCCFFFFR